MNQSRNDEITMTYSSLLQKNGQKAICVRFERTSDTGSDYAEALLPDHRINKQSGFTEEEIVKLEELIPDWWGKGREEYLKGNKDYILQEAKKISGITHWF